MDIPFLSNSEEENDPDDVSTWQLIKIQTYSLPSSPVAHTVKRTFRSLLQRLNFESSIADSPYKEADLLRQMDKSQLDRVAPYPDWGVIAAELAAERDRLLTNSAPDIPVFSFIGSPHSGYREILDAWVDHGEFVVLEPPMLSQIESADKSWVAEIGKLERPWIMPALEKSFLREVGGLRLVRHFLDQAYSGHLGRGIIGCSSWSWAYLSHVWHGQLPDTISLAPFNRVRLENILQNLHDSADGAPLIFRQADNGSFLLLPPEFDLDDREKNEKEIKTNNFIARLAAYSRGNFGVAWAQWRTSLKEDPDQGKQDDLPEQLKRFEVVWVTPWDDLYFPEIASAAEREEGLVLHALLLNNGLTTDLLQRLLPLEPTEIKETLFQLQRGGLIKRDQGDDLEWQVTALGYPVVREALAERGFLLDDF